MSVAQVLETVSPFRCSKGSPERSSYIIHIVQSGRYIRSSSVDLYHSSVSGTASYGMQHREHLFDVT